MADIMVVFYFKCVLLFFVLVSSVEACSDKTDCETYPRSTCTKYASWSKFNCAKWCDLCDSGVEDCPSGWSYSRSDKTCFRLYGVDDGVGRKTWVDARSYCKTKGGNLVMIKDYKKNDFISPLLSKQPYYWIGIKNVDKNGKIRFKYVDGLWLNPASFTNWKKGEPNNSQNNEHCVVIMSNGEWSDIGCEKTNAFICQRDTLTR